MNKQPITLSPDGYPDAIRPYLTAGNLYDSSCGAEAQTFYCDAGTYIKIAPAGTLAREAALARRFYGLGLGVEVLCYLSADRDYLVTRSASGEDLTHFLDDPQRLCAVLASSLRRLHSFPVTGVELSPQFRHARAICEGPFRDGPVEEYLLMDCFPIRSRAEAWNIIQSHKDKLKADTLIHGDACLPNVICRDGCFSAFIDLGQAGAGDRHTDLFWALWSLRFNLKTEAFTDLFLDLYGRAHFDPDQLLLAAALELCG